MPIIMAPPKAISKEAPRSCEVCKRVDKKDATIKYCTECQKSYHDLCRLMTTHGKLIDSSSKVTYICSKCKQKQLKETPKATKSKDTTKSHKHLPSSPLLSSTPAHPVAIAQGQTARRAAPVKALTNQRNSVSGLKINTPSMSKQAINSNSIDNSVNNTTNNNISKTTNNNFSTTLLPSAIAVISPAVNLPQQNGTNSCMG